jgi:hypothetical protein
MGLMTNNTFTEDASYGAAFDQVIKVTNGISIYPTDLYLTKKQLLCKTTNHSTAVNPFH